MASPSSFSRPRNWVYDVFPSFSGEDVRVTFLSHFLKELDWKLIIAFKDNDIERSHSLDPELKQAIRTSRIAVVVFSEKYPSSSCVMDGPSRASCHRYTSDSDQTLVARTICEDSVLNHRSKLSWMKRQSTSCQGQIAIDIIMNVPP
uniref:TIR domain-containing protein n=1 Tax=Brassica oleracea var. oleracea TaxID=109376 RepID=A0A0D3D9I4_BRAOL